MFILAKHSSQNDHPRFTVCILWYGNTAMFIYIVICLHFFILGDANCILCGLAPREVLFDKCNHCVACKQCAHNLTNCPFKGCNVKI